MLIYTIINLFKKISHVVLFETKLLAMKNFHGQAIVINKRCINKSKKCYIMRKKKKNKKFYVPLVGLEPTIPGLGDRCLIH